MPRWAAKVDGPHSAIVKALRKVGCQVADLSRLGDGVPDLLVRAPIGAGQKVSREDWIEEGRRIVLMEVKRPGGKLRASQKLFRAAWPEVVVVESVEQALAEVGIR